MYSNYYDGTVQTHVTSQNIIRLYSSYTLITVAARSKAWTVFARSNIGIVGSDPTQGMDVCVRLFCVLCAGSGLASGWSPVQWILPSM
jgi:hypothetical protein